MPAVKDSVFADLSTTVTRWIEREKLRKSGTGTDFTADEYRDAAADAAGRLHPERMKLKVFEIVNETSTAKTLRFTRTDGDLPPFRAGQYINLFAKINGIATSRPYSISSPPGARYLDITVREKRGGFVSTYLFSKVAAGDILESTGPAGSFYHEPLIDRGDLVLLAGGSGITPFMSMIRTWAGSKWPCRVHLLYGSRNADDVIFGAELEEISKKGSMLDYRLIISEPAPGYQGYTGFITSKAILEALEDVDGRTFLICGPDAMYKAVVPELEKLKVPLFKIRRESFGLPDDPSGLPGWPAGLNPSAEFRVRIRGGAEFTARAGEPILNSLERAGLSHRCVCRTGHCSYCRTKLVSGRVLMPPDVALREADGRWGYIHICAAYPLTDIEIGI